MCVHCVFGKSFKGVDLVLSVSDGLMSQTQSDGESVSPVFWSWKLPAEGNLFCYISFLCKQWLLSSTFCLCSFFVFFGGEHIHISPVFLLLLFIVVIFENCCLVTAELCVNGIPRVV